MGPRPDLLAELAEPLSALERAAQELPLDFLPELQGWSARLNGLISLRFLRQGGQGGPSGPPASSDRSLTVPEAAARLGRSKWWLYRHAGELPFRVRLPGNRLGFSEAGLNRYLRRKGLGAASGS